MSTIQTVLTEPIMIDGVEFDVLLDVGERTDSNVPAYAVEAGWEITDDILPQLHHMDMTLFVSPYPVTWRNRPGHYMREPREVIQQIKQIFDARKPVTVVTRKKTYNEMMMQKFRVSRSTETGNGMEVSVSFVKMERAPSGSFGFVPDRLSTPASGEKTSQILEVGSADGSISLESLMR